jgi:hypothetical protein
VGLVVTGSPSGATGTIIKDEDFGTTGILTVKMISGIFTAADTITDTDTGSADVDTVTNDRIIIEDTTSYDGEYTITNLTSTTFEITAVFVATETGNHYKVQVYSVIDREFKNDQGNTTLSTEIDMSTNDVIFMGVENTTASNGFNTNTIQIPMRGE